MAFVSDTFTDTAGTALTAHTPDTGGAWAKFYTTGYPGDADIISGGLLGAADTDNDQGFFYNAATPPSADYVVRGQVTTGSSLSDLSLEIAPFLMARLTGQGTSTWDGYQSILYVTSTTGDVEVRLARVDNGTGTQIDTAWTSAGYLAINSTYEWEFRLNGSSLEVWFDGVKRLEATDATYSAAGKVGIRLQNLDTGRNGRVHLTLFEATEITSGETVRGMPRGVLRGVLRGVV